MRASIKQLANITSGMVITPSSSKIPFCSVCVEAKSQDSHIESLGHILRPPDFVHMLMLEVVVIIIPNSADFATLFFLFVKQRVMYG